MFLVKRATRHMNENIGGGHSYTLRDLLVFFSSIEFDEIRCGSFYSHSLVVKSPTVAAGDVSTVSCLFAFQTIWDLESK